MSLITEEIKAKADEFYTGNSICQHKSKQLLKDMGLPNGLLPLEDMEECGYIHETGFVWLKQKMKTEHKFEKIGKLASYATEVTAYIEPGRIKKLTGVKTRMTAVLIWLTVSDIFLDDPPTGKINFQVPPGMSLGFPVSAFEVEEEEEVVVKVVEGSGDGATAAVEVKEV